MRFHFQLEGLLRVRRLLERQARDRLEKTMMRVHALEHSLADAQRWSQSTARIITSKSLLPACELQFAESALRQAQRGILQCQLQKEAAEQQAAELRSAFLLAQRERMTVSTLRENALQQFQIEQARREQSALDEMFLGKLIHSRNADRSGSEAVPECGGAGEHHDSNLTC
jgi:flagellar export protein FliJ